MKRAFTLIELLVVIAVICVLAAILLPVLASARESARQTTCISNHHQVGAAILMYQDDYDERFPLLYRVFPDYSDPALRATPTGSLDDTPRDGPWQLLLLPYLRNRQVLFCPSSGSDDLWEQYGMPPQAALCLRNFFRDNYYSHLLPDAENGVEWQGIGGYFPSDNHAWTYYASQWGRDTAPMMLSQIGDTSSMTMFTDGGGWGVDYFGLQGIPSEIIFEECNNDRHWGPLAFHRAARHPASCSVYDTLDDLDGIVVVSFVDGHSKGIPLSRYFSIEQGHYRYLWP